MSQSADKSFLLRTAKLVAAELQRGRYGTSLRIRMPRAVRKENTGGWAVTLGSLGRSRLRVELWFDKFTGADQRRLYVSVNSRNRRAMSRLANGVARKLRPHRVITNHDLGDRRFVSLAQRLRRDEFGVPLFERYDNGWSFYGFYDSARAPITSGVSSHFVTRGATFLESVARTLPRASAESEDQDVYPKIENRKCVAEHLRRERSRWLANERKILDRYTCQVCEMRFEDVYGELGRDFAESHHTVPLNRLRGKVKTSLEDLRTVCANCHRMLHRMKGEQGDVQRLKRLFRRKK